MSKAIELNWWIEYKDTDRVEHTVYCTSMEDGRRVARYLAFLYGESDFKGKNHYEHFERGSK